MKRRKHIVINRMFLLGIVLSLFFVSITEAMAFEGIGAEFWGALLLTLLLLTVSLVVIPPVYVFDSEGITIVRLFFKRERYLWSRISSISLERHHRLGSYYLIKGTPEGVRKRYMEGEVFKNFRVKRLFARYYDSQIEGQTSRRRKRKFNKSHKCDAAQVSAQEREMRTCVRERLAPIIERAATDGLFLTTEYLYVDSKRQQLRSRPDDRYVYMALVSISDDEEKHKRRTVQVSADLIRVRQSKKMYVGVIDEDGVPSLVEMLEDTLSHIRQNGLESYLSDQRE